MRSLMLVATAAVLAGCSAAEAPPPAQEVPAKLAAGQWEVTSRVTALRSTDRTTPALQAKIGDTATASGCVAANGTPPAELFALQGHTCSPQNPYVRNGRMNLQLDCSASDGKVMGDVTGTFTADALTATVTSNSYFPGSGDYELKREITGRRVGECAPQVAGQ